MKIKSLSVNESAALATMKPAMYLDRLVVEVINVRSMIECFLKCLQLHDCVSSNFYKGSHHRNNICVLNAATTKEHNALIGNPGKTYYGVDVTEWIYIEMME